VDEFRLSQLQNIFKETRPKALLASLLTQTGAFLNMEPSEKLDS
jgi:hypothetical protein